MTMSVFEKILGTSIKAADKAGDVVRGVMKGGNLEIVEKVSSKDNLGQALFLCVFEKLKVKKTQAPEKLKVFSAKKLKAPEVFRPFLLNSRYQRLKTQEKIFILLKSCLKTRFA